MPEKKDSDSIHGLSIVDTTMNETSHSDEDRVTKSEDGDSIVKIEDEVAVDNDEKREDLDAVSSLLEESDEKINLFDVLSESEETVKESKDTMHNSTLIITTEEHLESTPCEDTLNTSTETVKNASASLNETVDVDSTVEETKETPTKKSKNVDHSYFWVSNITRYIKAADLKKLFSQIGKVITAKILTNGKNYFGYVCVDSLETASNCIKQLNNTVFEGKKILVSKDRPDLRETKAIVKSESRRKRNEKVETKKGDKSIDLQPTSEKHQSKKVKVEDEDVKTNEVIADLKKKLEKSKEEVTRYKWKLVEYQRRHDGMRKKCSNLEKELKEAQYNMRSERRRLNQEKEQFEKSKKMDLIRLEADKTVINKELAEVKKLREHLKTKIEEFKAHTKKNPKKRNSRSPPPVERSRSPRGRSPLLRPVPRMPYRSEDRVDKKRKREEPPRGRTPPPPPKLSNGIGKKRVDNPPHRQYFDEVDKRSSTLDHGHGYDYRHKSSFAPPPQEMSRGPWQNSYPKDPRRVNTAPSGGQTYPPDPRYNSGYQFPPSSVTVPPRSYYPGFNKPYGHY